MSTFATVLEIIMIACFGASWPFNVMKSYKARTTKGKSLAFLCLIFFGYIAGTSHKGRSKYDRRVLLRGDQPCGAGHSPQRKILHYLYMAITVSVRTAVLPPHGSFHPNTVPRPLHNRSPPSPYFFMIGYLPPPRKFEGDFIHFLAEIPVRSKVSCKI